MVNRKVDYDITILGGGASSVYAAFKLKSQNVSLVYSEESLGGILNGKKWKNFYVDNGCHLFDGNEKQFEFYESIGGMKPHSVKYGSINSGKFTNEIATPEINDNKLSIEAFEELNNFKFFQNKEKEAETLKDVFLSRFGITGGNYLSEVQKKFTGLNSELINGSEFNKFSIFHRLRVGDDKMSNKLKQKNSYLDQIICASLESRGLNKFQVSMYPKDLGTSSFSRNSEAFLNSTNISKINKFKVETIINKKNYFEIHDIEGNKITTKFIISTLPYGQFQKYLGFPTTPPLEFINYKIIVIEVDAKKISDIYYVQDFDLDNLTYRGSNMGYYSNQFSEDNTTFVTAEIPYASADIHINIEKIKEELIKQNILSSDCEVLDYKIIDKKNVIPINNEVNEVGFPNGIYSLESNSFSLKKKMEDVDNICSRLVKEI